MATAAVRKPPNRYKVKKQPQRDRRTLERGFSGMFVASYCYVKLNNRMLLRRFRSKRAALAFIRTSMLNSNVFIGFVIAVDGTVIATVERTS